MNNDLPLSLYVHIPWCVRKCPYCDFNSHAASGDIPERKYTDALLQDLANDQPLSQGRKLTSIFFGGGTPSLFSANSIHRIIEYARTTLGFVDDIEITLEANPGTVEYTSFDELRAAGVNRLSLGIQSFNDKHLTRLGRIHSGENAVKAFEKARVGGFGNINLDLMHGLPEQEPAHAIHDLERAFELNPEHISWYQLTIEPNTIFYNTRPQLPEDDALADIQEAGETFLKDNAYEQYEVSAFARSGRESRHNLNYWEFGDYLGIGAGAHGKITRMLEEENLSGKNPPSLTIQRYRKTRKPEDYLNPQKPFCAGMDTVPKEKQLLEFMMNALRLKRGVSTNLLDTRTLYSSLSLAPKLQPLIDRGLMQLESGKISTSELGFRFLNSILAAFDD